MALSTYRYVPSGTQQCSTSVMFGTCQLVLSTYRYVPSDIQLVPIHVTWHSSRNGTCHLTLNTTIPTVCPVNAPDTQHYHTNGMSDTCHLTLNTTIPTVCPVRAIGHSDRTATCILVLSTYSTNCMFGSVI
jgi:hypothetical protein